MAIVTRYFSTAAAGAGDGTTWADRAVFFTAGAYSTVITGFSFAGSDSLKVLIGPGTHTVTVAMASGLFANPPTAANPIMFYGCDSSGNELAPPDPDWTSDRPNFDSSGFPVISTTSNINTSSIALSQWRCIAFTASGRNGALISDSVLDWCVVTNSTSNTSAACITSISKITNCVLTCTGTSYAQVASLGAGTMLDNIRIIGNSSASSGNRDGLTLTGTTVGTFLSRACSFNNPGAGIISSSTNVNQRFFLSKCMAIDNTGSGFKFASTASQVGVSELTHCMATGNGAYGLDAQSAANVLVLHSRFRDNTSGNFNGLGNYPVSGQGIYTTDSDDASEYRDSSTDDFQIKSGATIAGYGFGISEQAAAGSSGSSYVFIG